MSEEKEYETLKANMIKSYLLYIEALEQSTFDELLNFDKSEGLLKKYIKAVKCNSAFKDFVITHTKRRF